MDDTVANDNEKQFNQRLMKGGRGNVDDHAASFSWSLYNYTIPYGNRHCQASKGFDKHVRDDDAGFVDTSKIYLDC
jgi:hypothetical protein